LNELTRLAPVQLVLSFTDDQTNARISRRELAFLAPKHVPGDDVALLVSQNLVRRAELPAVAAVKDSESIGGGSMPPASSEK
jgi:hypothetical protein